jgi:hypothetical protein
VSVAALSGCGGATTTSGVTHSASAGAQPAASRAGSTTPRGAPASSGSAALHADAHSAATGDIPDNQVFLSFRSATARWSMKYPEGWTQTGRGRAVTFRDKNNLVRVTIGPGGTPTGGSVIAQLKAQQRTTPTLAYGQPSSIRLAAGPAILVRYATRSAADPVTGRRVHLLVDRYVFAHGSRVATVDLGTPKGVDNVDAYRMMIHSFRWR